MIGNKTNKTEIWFGVREAEDMAFLELHSGCDQYTKKCQRYCLSPTVAVI